MFVASQLRRLTGAVGRRAIAMTGDAGRSVLFLGGMFRRMFAPPFRVHDIAEHLRFIGNRSVWLIVLTSSFTGMVLTLQGYDALVRFGSEVYLGPLVSLSLIRELGPVLAALMATARAGSAIAATVAGMRVTEQIEALEALAVDPVQYLCSTRLIAALIGIPVLTGLFDIVGIFVALAFGSLALGIDSGSFMSSIRASVEWSDVSAGIVKSFVFAALIVWVSCYQGYHATRGALGIGQATTTSVVSAAVLILAADYFLTALFF